LQGSLLEKYRVFLVDLDGVIYLLDQAIKGSPEAINGIVNVGCKVLFLTNNSIHTPKHYAKKLKNFGISVTPEQVITSSIATREYLRKNYMTNGLKAYIIGEEGLRREVASLGIEIVSEAEAEGVNFVIVGLDRSFNFEKLKAACIGIRSGGILIGTNSDATYPTPLGLWPGAGAILAAVKTAGGSEPVILGKPNPLMIEIALDRTNAKSDDVLLIGDRLETDILAGIRAGLDTLLVLSGVSKREDVEKSGIKPTYIMDSISGLFEE